MRWFRFFFGTPARALATLIALVTMAALEHFAPGTIAAALIAVGTQVLTAVIALVERFLGPLAYAFLPLIIAGIGFRIMMRGFGGGGKRKKKR